MHNLEKHVWNLFFFSIMIFFLAGCMEPEPLGAFPPISESNELEAAAKEDLPSLSSSYITARTYEELASRSSLIVIGQVEQTENVLNLARNVDDVSYPDLDIMNLGQVYQVKASGLIKGERVDALFIVQPEGFLIRSVEQQGRPFTENEIQLARQQTDHLAFTSGHNYLFFLEPLHGFDTQQYFVGVAHPWRFDVTDPDNVVPESPWEGATRAFPPVTLPEILRKIGYELTPVVTTIFESPLPTPQPGGTSFISPLTPPTLEVEQ